MEATLATSGTPKYHWTQGQSIGDGKLSRYQNGPELPATDIDCLNNSALDPRINGAAGVS
jgi:hypothetical protein